MRKVRMGKGERRAQDLTHLTTMFYERARIMQAVGLTEKRFEVSSHVR